MVFLRLITNDNHDSFLVVNRVLRKDYYSISFFLDSIQLISFVNFGLDNDSVHTFISKHFDIRKNYQMIEDPLHKWCLTIVKRKDFDANKIYYEILFLDYQKNEVKLQ